MTNEAFFTVYYILAFSRLSSENSIARVISIRSWHRSNRRTPCTCRIISVADIPLDLLHAVLDTNLTGVFYCCRAAIPWMRKRGGGFIINISSLAGVNPIPNLSAYNASKFGLVGFSDAFMQEIRHDGIRVSTILPGSVDTEFGGRSPGQESWRLAPEDVARVVVQLLSHDPRSLPSRVEIRPSMPPK